MSAGENTLIGINGRPRFGIHAQPLTSFNLDAFRPYGSKTGALSAKNWILQFRIKRWEYLGLCNKDVVFGMAVVRLGYLCNLFAYLFDRHSSRITQYDVLTPGGNAAIFAGTSLTGDVTFRCGKTAVRVSSDANKMIVEGTIRAELFISLLFQKYRQPLVCVTRVGQKGFNYTHKEAGFPVQGTIRHKDESWDIQKEQSFGVRDYTLGYLSRHTFWNWASGGGIDQEGRRIGFNLVQGINETGFTENAFWIDGCIVKTDVVDFQYDEMDALKPWCMASNDGRVLLRFYPEGVRSTDIHAGLIASKFRQPFGRFEGVLRHGDQVSKMHTVSGFTEEHYAKW